MTSEPAVNNCGSRIFKWKPTTLVILFGGQKQPPSQLSPVEIDAELALMQALAEVEEDEWLDDGEIKGWDTLLEHRGYREAV
jgi:hypothetical protein